MSGGCGRRCSGRWRCCSARPCGHRRSRRAAVARKWTATPSGGSARAWSRTPSGSARRRGSSSRARARRRASRSIPLGYELKAKGKRRATGRCSRARSRPSPTARRCSRATVSSATDQAEAQARQTGPLPEGDGPRRRASASSIESGPAGRARAAASSTTCCRPTCTRESVRIYVIENKEWNAFAMGNYSIYVFTGLLDDMDDDEVAIVLGHELVHATHEHSRKQFKRDMWVQLAMLGALGAASHDRQRHEAGRRRAGGARRRNGAARTATAAAWRTRPTASACATRTRRATTSRRARGCGTASPRSTARATRPRTSSSATTRCRRRAPPSSRRRSPTTTPTGRSRTGRPTRRVPSRRRPRPRSPPRPVAVPANAQALAAPRAVPAVARRRPPRPRAPRAPPGRPRSTSRSSRA